MNGKTGSGQPLPHKKKGKNNMSNRKGYYNTHTGECFICYNWSMNSIRKHRFTAYGSKPTDWKKLTEEEMDKLEGKWKK